MIPIDGVAIKALKAPMRYKLSGPKASGSKASKV